MRNPDDRLGGAARRRPVTRRAAQVLLRAAFVVAGAVVLLVGVVMVPLPGPGSLVMAVGLALVARGSERARRLQERLYAWLASLAPQAVQPLVARVRRLTGAKDTSNA